MRIAFVGKGGSGKTTLSSLFVRWLTIATKHHVVAVDADINSHLHQLVGVPRPNRGLSQPEHFEWLKQYVRGTNARVPENRYVIRTTPPGQGSRLIRFDREDECLSYFAERSAALSFITVGGYLATDVGMKCYHNNLEALEILLAHSIELPRDIYVLDMVAGVDAFATTLFAQIDAFFFVVEPTEESVGVYKNFLELAQQSGVADRVFAVANKIEDVHDLAFLKQLAGLTPAATFPYHKHLRQVRQRGEIVRFEELGESVSMFEALLSRVTPMHPDERLKRMHTLHRGYMKRSHIAPVLGDLSMQIDDTFQFPSV